MKLLREYRGRGEYVGGVMRDDPDDDASCSHDDLLLPDDTWLRGRRTCRLPLKSAGCVYAPMVAYRADFIASL